MPWGAATAALSRCVYLYLDIETTGFNFMTDNILSIQLSCDGDDQWVFLTKDTPEMIPKLFHLLNNAKMLVGHNIKFDLKFLIHRGYVLKTPIYDTMLCEKILTNGTFLKAGLDAVTLRYCGVQLDKQVRTSFSDTLPMTPRQLKYAADDVKYLPAIMETQIVELNKKGLMDVARLECQTAQAFIAIEINGLAVNTEKWSSMIETLRQQAIEGEKQMNTIINSDNLFDSVRTKTFQTDMFISNDLIKGTHINWSSPAEVLKVFKCVNKKISGTSEQDTYIIAKKHEIGKLLRKHREDSKRVSAFGENFLAHIYPDGKVHPNFRQIMRTGRVSCNSPNMQQIPASNEYRNCFICDEGDVFVSADYSSQELCIIAHGSQDPVFLHALNNGHDLHSVCAALVFGDRWKDAALDDCTFMSDFSKCSCPEHKVLRTTVKTVNFGLAFGMGPRKLADTVEISVSEASALIEEYFKAFPKIKDFLEGMSRYGVAHGYIQTFKPWSRMRWFPEWSATGMDMATKSRIERTSKNTPIQGTGADMTKHALILCHQYIRDNDIPVKLVMTVHDQIDTTCPLEYSLIWAKQLKDLMEEAAHNILGNDLLKAEVEITETWSK